MSNLEWPKKALRQVTPLRPVSFGWHHVPFVVLYAIAIKWCYDTSGEPLATALAARAATEAALALNGTATATMADEAAAAAAAVASDSLAGDVSEPKEVPLPNELLPSFWALLMLVAALLGHTLLWFAQRWSVRFAAWLRYTRAPSSAALQRGTPLLVEPHPHQGRPAVVRIDTASDGALFFRFQRQRYDVDAARRVVRLPR
jgi:hypothetical protein